MLTSITLKQALFTSACSQTNEGYQLTEHSPGIDSDTQRELAAWAPSHDSLQAGASSSINGHTLADGRYCLSVTRATQQEYSGRGRNFATWMLIAEPLALARFAYHPLRLFDAAMAAGWGGDREQGTGERLELVGRVSPLHVQEVALATSVWGGELLAAVVELAGGERPFAVTLAKQARLLLDALCSLTPADRRMQLSFTTGLVPSPRRPFQFHALQPQRELSQDYRRVFSGTVLDPADFQPATSHRGKEVANLLQTQAWSAVGRLAFS